MFKLVSLRASGFKRLDIGEKLEFPDGRILVHGRNESGKSTLLEAIHYALYGMPLRPSKNAGNNDIIHYGREEANVELEFSIGDDNYQVRRNLYKKKTNHHLLNRREPNGKLTRIVTGARNVNTEISEILHGIDSDALLNSCLVEQKELGKLEASSKQERIKAMSSLLNLEAFIDSKDKLKKEASNLEKTHLQTINKLADAEKAKQEYQKAEKQRKQAEKRLREISEEEKETQERLEKIQKDLSILKRLKNHQIKINETKINLKAKSKELELLSERLTELEEAEKELEKIQEKIPKAEKQLAKVEKKLETVQKLSTLREKLREAESSLENIEIRYSETERAHLEASEAGNRVKELLNQIKEYMPVKTASEKLTELITQFNKLSASNTEIDRVNGELEAVKNRLGDSENSSQTLKMLDQEEKQTKKRREKAETMRTYGFGASMLGLLLSLVLSYFIHLSVGIVIGVMGTVVGGYLFLSFDPRQLETELDGIRKQREGLLGEQARLQDYLGLIKNHESQLREEEKAQNKTHETINKILNQLPNQPREYRTTVSLSDPETLNTLRTQIQEDTQTLTRLTTEKNNYQTRANNQTQLEALLDSIKKEREAKTSEAEDLRNKIKATEQETDITEKQEQEIKNEYSEANKTLIQLTTQQTNHQASLERRPQVQENISETTTDINLLTTAKEKEEKQFNKLSQEGVKLEEEATLSEERNECLKTQATLKKDEEERNKDISQSNEVMERTSELMTQHPKLCEKSELEEFTIESMRKATILLDTTRESIMAGVKQNIEKNMMQFLPTLTDNRYNRAQIDEINYRIKVYDREARHWRGKGVFSGATQDQFSLALRLAFAISTIPQTRGARPGFIFLDEPLSGFDTQRKHGFLSLLEEELSKHFHQIIVISHLDELRNDFQHHITLDSGNIIKVQR